MKIQFTEEQLKYIIKEEEENAENAKLHALANSLLNDPKNEVVWVVYPSDAKNGIFANGFSAEFSGTKEGTFHGKGQYCFYKPFGPNYRMEQASRKTESLTGGCNLGNRIAKCALVNGFKNCLIFDRQMAYKYYHSTDFMAQLDAIFDDDNLKKRMYQTYCNYSHYRNGQILDVSNPGVNTAGFSVTFETNYGPILRSSKCRGIVYNGGNDHYAAIMYSRRDFYPIYSTDKVFLPNSHATDFTGYEFLFTKEEYDKISTFGDQEATTNMLKNLPEVKEFSKNPPVLGYAKVTLKNGKTSFYDLKNHKIIFKSGFDMALGFEKDEDGDAILPCILRGREFTLIPQDGQYYFCLQNENGEYQIAFSAEQYDKKMGLNESKLLKEGYYGSYSGPIVERNTPELIADFCKRFGFSGNVESVYQGVKDDEGLEGIKRWGFSPEFSSTECYGHGAYTCITLHDSVTGVRLPRIVHAFVLNGFKDFIIMNPTVATKYYGEFNPLNQFYSLIRPQYKDELMKKVHYIDDKFIKRIFPELGKTKIRGIIYNYGWSDRPVWATVMCDWKCAIPYEYSTDMGQTWKPCLTDTLVDTMKNNQDGLFRLLPYLQDGIVEDTWGILEKIKYQKESDWRVDKDLHPKFVNGHLRVKLTSNGNVSFINAKGNLISKNGFSEAFGFQKDEDGDLIMPCEIKINTPKGLRALNFICVKQGDSYLLCTQNSEGELVPFMTTEQLDQKLGL